MNLHHLSETYRGHTIPHFRFVERKRLWFTLSGIVILLGIAGFIVRGGLNLSIDFEGGAQIAYPLQSDVTAQDISGVLADNGRPDAEVQIVNGDTVSIRTETLAGAVEADALISSLAKQAGITVTEVSIQDIGPTWGAEISRKALFGLVIVLIAIMIYISFRFEWKMAVGAIIALLHDVLITIGVYALVGREVTPETVIAILTILGFSLYDTVVIYDKIRENTESSALVSKLGYDGVVDLSLNQTFMRSVNTSLVVLLPILSLLLFGGDTLKDFAFAMFIGVATGAYSSIFIAAPVLTMLKKRDKRYQQIEARRTARTRTATTEPAPSTVAAASTSDAAAQATTARVGASSKPRPKNKKRPPAKRKRR